MKKYKLKTNYSTKLRYNLNIDKNLSKSINQQYNKNIDSFLNTINNVFPKTCKKKRNSNFNGTSFSSSKNSSISIFPLLTSTNSQKNNLNKHFFLITPKQTKKDFNPLNLFNITTVQKIMNCRNNMKYARFSLLFKNRTKYKENKTINLYQNPLTTRETDIYSTNNEVIFPLTNIKTETIKTEENIINDISHISDNINNSFSSSENDEEENRDKFEVNLNKHVFMMKYFNNPNNNFILTESDKYKSRYQGDLFLHEKIKEIINQRYFLEVICNNKPIIKSYLINYYSILENKMNFIEDINRVPSIKNNLIFLSDNETITYKSLMNNFKSKIDKNCINYLVDDKTYLNLLFKIQVQTINKDKKLLTTEEKYTTNIDYHAYDEKVKYFINNKFNYPCNDSVSIANNNLKNAIYFYGNKKNHNLVNKDKFINKEDPLWFFKKHLGENFRDFILIKKNNKSETKNHRNHKEVNKKITLLGDKNAELKKII